MKNISLPQLKRLARLSMLGLSAPGLCLFFFGYIARRGEGSGLTSFVLGGLALGIPLVLAIWVKIWETQVRREENDALESTAPPESVSAETQKNLMALYASRNFLSILFIALGAFGLYFPKLVFQFEWMIPTLLIIFVGIGGMLSLIAAIVVWLVFAIMIRRAKID